MWQTQHGSFDFFWNRPSRVNFGSFCISIFYHTQVIILSFISNAFICVCVGGWGVCGVCARHRICMKIRGQLVGVSFFHHMGTRDSNQVIRLGGMPFTWWASSVAHIIIQKRERERKEGEGRKKEKGGRDGSTANSSSRHVGSIPSIHMIAHNHL